MEPSQDTIQLILQREAAVRTRLAAAHAAARERLTAVRAAAEQDIRQAEQDGRDAAAIEVAAALRQLEQETAAHLAAAQVQTEEIVARGEHHVAPAAARALALLIGEPP